MLYPDYFTKIERIKLQDPLSDFLGVFEDGLVEFSYLDIVKNAGHSCPTIAGAYLMCLKGLKALYADEIPQRGNIAVSFKEDKEDGVIGVIANVVTHITGATETSGFKGINGKFIRSGLISFNQSIKTDMKMTRLDTNKSVELCYDPSSIEVDPIQKTLMLKVLQNNATENEKKGFKQVWQERVEKIFDNSDNVITVKE